MDTWWPCLAHMVRRFDQRCSPGLNFFQSSGFQWQSPEGISFLIYFIIVGLNHMLISLPNWSINCPNSSGFPRLSWSSARDWTRISSLGVILGSWRLQISGKLLTKWYFTKLINYFFLSGFSCCCSEDQSTTAGNGGTLAHQPPQGYFTVN